MEIQCGTKAFDKNGRFIGEIDQTILNLLTGEIAYFFVKEEKSRRNVICRPQDVEELSESELKLKFSSN